MKKIILTLSILSCVNVFANPDETSVWQDYQENTQSQLGNISAKNTIKQRTLILDAALFKSQLSAASNDKQSSRPVDESPHVEVDLPLPGSGFVRVKATDSPILSPQMAERYPDIRTWSVVGVDDPAISGRIDFTPSGFHGMLTLADGDMVYIDPENKMTGNVYRSLSKRENASYFSSDFSCQSDDDHATYHISKPAAKVLASAPASLKTYRLAVAATAEYTASQGGSKSSAYASMVTTINRVNQIYQRDIGISLQLVSGEQLIYTDAATDPYTNNNAGALVSENIANMDTNFGVANFDLGHVFAQGPLGGLAFVGVACINTANTSNGTVNAVKAGGVTGILNPQGEAFSIEYVAHEIGHQLGATHTFNSTLNGCGDGDRTAATAVEPGSGSTIMSYSGLCGSDNLQFNSDAMFHFASISQINSYTQNGSGSTCGTNSASGNQNPVANAGPDVTIPANTPFFLDGSATGGSSYSWDQTDTGSASTVNVDTGNNAIIRVLLPSSDEDRYIPRLSDLFSGSSTIGEKLPQTSRELNFTYVVRDGSGGVGFDSKKLNVTDTQGTFSVVSQSSAETLSIGQTISVLWNTAKTNTAPVNCSMVDIQLLRTNGVKNMLLASTDNDGNEQLTIPTSTPAMNGARLMVACSDSSFFNISTGEITIPDTTSPVITLNGSSTVDIVQGSAYTEAGATAVDNVDGNINVQISGTVNTSVTGSYTITYQATDQAGNVASKTRTVNVTVAPAPDTTSPVITLNDSSTVDIVQGSAYTEAGATAVDNVDGNINVQISGTVNTSVTGSYTITYQATDQAGNVTSKTRTVSVVPDTTSPVITLNGSSTVDIVQGSTYTEAGATAVDDVDGNLAVSTSGTVNTAVVGSYTITYQATDQAGNVTSKTRTVSVVPDTTSPVITLNGSSTVDIVQGSTYTEAGATAVDDVDGNLAVSTSGTVNTAVVGSYTITYQATDQAGNVTSKTRTVSVVPDTTSPVITLNGSSTVDIVQGSTYTEAGATAVDDVDGNLAVSTSGTVNTAVVGSYTITYQATDQAANVASKTRTVNVTAAPNSGGGSVGYLLLTLMLMLGLRRYKPLKIRKGR